MNTYGIVKKDKGKHNDICYIFPSVVLIPCVMQIQCISVFAPSLTPTLSPYSEPRTGTCPTTLNKATQH